MTSRSLIAWIIPALALCLVAANSPEADKVATFSALPTTDTLQVRLNSSGCFHYYTYDFTFQRGATNHASVASLLTELEHLETNVGTKAGRNWDGSVCLRRISRGWTHRWNTTARSPPAACTTVVRVSISQVRNGRILATENFVDGSCGTHRFTPSNGHQFVTFHGLLKRLPQDEVKSTIRRRSFPNPMRNQTTGEGFASKMDPRARCSIAGVTRRDRSA